MNFKRLGFITIALFVGSNAYCQLIEWDVSGPVNLLIPEKTVPDWLPDSNFGDNFEIKFSVDSSEAPEFAFPGFSIYSLPNALATIGSHTWALDNCALTIFAQPGNYAFFFNGSDLSNTLQFSVGLNTSEHSGNTDIPTSLPTLQDFDIVHYLQVYDSNETEVTGLYADVTHVTLTAYTSAVPEPSTYAAGSIIALFAIVGMRKRKA